MNTLIKNNKGAVEIPDSGDVIKLQVRVYYEDTDANGVVYYANYLRYFERARTEWMRSMGLPQTNLRQDNNLLFVIKHFAMDYFRPAILDDLLDVVIHKAKIRYASLVIDQSISRNNDLITKCHAVVACVDAITLKPKAIPKEIMQQCNEHYDQR